MKFVKLICLMVPPLRRLYEERNSLREERNSLMKERGNLVEERNTLLDRARTRHRLHVVGFARSGTTILMDILNSSQDIFLFSEFNLHIVRRFPYIFVCYGGGNPVESFEKRKLSELPLLYKGAKPPPMVGPWKSADDYFDGVGFNYRFVGDKIAVAEQVWDGVHALELLKEFLEQEEDACMFFTLRRPSENLLSVSKMFPAANLKEWAGALAQAMSLILQAFMRSNRAYLVFHEDIGPPLVRELATLLGVRLDISLDLVGAEYQQSRGQYPAILENADWLIQLDQCYAEIYEIFRCDKTILKHSRTDALAKKMSEKISRLEDITVQMGQTKTGTLAEEIPGVAE